MPSAAATRSQEADFNEREQAIRIDASFSISSEDLALFHRMGIVSQYRRYEVWRRVFGERLPSFSQGELCFTFHVNKDGSCPLRGYFPEK